MKILAILTTESDKHSLRPEIEQFIEMHRQGISIDVMTHLDSEYAMILRNEGVKIVGDFPATKRSKSAIQDIRTLLIQNDYDILHVLQRKAVACGLKAARGLRTKIVVYRGASGLYWHDPSAYENALNPRVDKVICVCNDIRNNLRNQLFFRKDKAITVYKGHELEWYKDIVALPRTELDLSDKSFVIACTANSRKWKGIPTFLDAVNLLPQDSNIQILLIGNGMDSSFYQNKINRNSNKSKIHLLGYRNDAMSIAKMADVMMQTSYKNEGLSRSTIEGMALGCAPIVTDAGGNAELVSHNECGLVVPPKDAQAMADAIMMLYNSPELTQKFSSASYERLKNNFTVAKTVKETIAVYKSLLK